MTARIFAGGKSVREVFQESRRIPAYQRDYSWQPKSQVNVLWEDILGHLENSAEDDYLLGPIIVTRETISDVTRETISDVIDGQQRLITLFLFQSAFRYRLKQLSGNPDFIKSIERGLVEYDDNLDRNIARIRHHDEHAQRALSEIASLEPVTRDVSTLDDLNASISRRRIIRAFRHLLSKVEELGEDVERIEQTVKAIRNQVQLIQIETSDVLQAIYVFERANFRGKPLDPSDLLKNLIFQRFSGDFEFLAGEWRKLQATLDSGDIQIMEFLRWYHLGTPNGFYATSKDFISSVTDYVKNQDPIDYIRNMTNRAEALTIMKRDWLEKDGPHSPHLAGIRSMSGGRQKAHWPLMLATVDWSISARSRLVSELERVIYYSLVCEVRSQDLERSMRAITVKARDGGEETLLPLLHELETLARSYYFGNFFEQKFVRLSYEDDLNLVRYTLRKINDGLYCDYHGKATTAADATSKDFENSEIEHIWPQADGEGLATDDDTDLVHRIGNLLLLSRAINRAGGRKEAELKLTKLYKEEEHKYLIANCLHQPLDSSGHNSHARAISYCPSGFTSWDADAVVKLAECYLSLINRYIPPPKHTAA